ncbi:hypothetical protein, partial [Williamsia sp.]|uniref:hypothetical protein n=1 Tax=Williamsia sp. TaxID=1872085 RepID=UPI001A33EA86
MWRELVRRCLTGASQITEFEIRFTTVGDTIYGDVRCYRAGDLVRHRGFGAPTAIPMPDCRDLLDELRAIEYHPDTGSFLTATIRGASIGAFSTRSDPLQTDAPSDDMHFDAADLRREAQRFPRSANPSWWIAIVEAADRQATAFAARKQAEPVAFTMSESDSKPAVAAQRVAVVGAVAATVGSIAPVVSVDAKRIRTVYRTPSTGFTHYQRNDDQVVLSGSSEAKPLLDPAAFAGVPEWVRIEHLD